MFRRVFSCIVFWTALGSFAPQSHAESTVALAKAAAATGDMEAATTILDEIITSNPQQADALLLRGSIRLDLRDWSGALEAYEQYIAVAPRGAQKRAVEKIVASLAPVRTSMFELTVAAGATVYLDSKSLGVFCQAAPTCSKNVLPGQHRLILEQDGYDKLVVAVTFEAGKTVRLSKTLQGKPTRLTLVVQPDGADVQVDGAPASALPKNQLAPGEHVLTVTLAGHASHSQTLTAVAGQPLDVNVQLRKLVVVKDLPSNATITVDGQAVQLINGELPLPADGKAHAIVVSAPDMQVKKIDASASDRELDARLRKAAVTLKLSAGTRSNAKLLIDGKAQGPAPWRIPPGEHTLEVRSSTGTAIRKATFDDDTDLRITSTPKRSRTKFWIALGATGAFAAVGGVTGYLALQDADRYTAYQKEAGATRTDPSSVAYRSSSENSALVSNLAFAGAGVAVLAATYFWVTLPKQPASLRLEIGPSGGGVSGRF